MITRPALRHFGGKWRIAPKIIALFPEHRVYVEPFGGGASVLLRKPRSRSEVYNDLDSEIVNVFRVLRDPVLAAELERCLSLTPFARAEFDEAHTVSADPVEQARRSIVRSFMGHGADSLTRQNKSGFRAKSFGSNRDASKDWINYAPCLPMFTERLRGVILENKDATTVMENNDGDETLHFVDPPYVHDTRTSTKHGYRHELSNTEHVALCEFLGRLKGKVVLCGYHNDIYDSLAWNKVEFAALADGAAERTEVLWFNDAAWSAQSQHSLFQGVS